MSKATLEKTLKDYEALADNPDLSAVKAAADALAKTVRDNLGQFHDEPVIFAGDVGVAITAPRKFTYEGIEYPTAQHAFQSQKLPEDEREDASKQTLKAVIALGHNAKLDVPKWEGSELPACILTYGQIAAGRQMWSDERYARSAIGDPSKRH